MVEGLVAGEIVRPEDAACPLDRNIVLRKVALAALAP